MIESCLEFDGIKFKSQQECSHQMHNLEIIHTMFGAVWKCVAFLLDHALGVNTSLRPKQIKLILELLPEFPVSTTQKARGKRPVS